MTDEKFAYIDLNSAIVFEKLLKSGLFPSSLMKIFSSENFGELILNESNESESMSVALDPSIFHNYSILPFSLTRNTNVSRALGIPHPLGFYHLSSEIRDNWHKIDKAVGENNPMYEKTSMIIPKNNDRLVSILYEGIEHIEILEGRLTQLSITQQEKRKKNASNLKKKFGAKYIVEADISGFFDNIYSHSIPWALLGKQKVKHLFQTRQEWEQDDKWANKLDMRSRNLKNKETNGIPIGPDTSHILSEIILAQVDKILLEKNYKYVRYIDDYSCFCKTEDKAKSFLKDLELELAVYNLKLNSNKTKIHSLPRYETSEAIRTIRTYKIPSLISPENFQQILDFLDLAVDSAKKQKDYSPFKYAIKKLSVESVSYESFEIFEIIFLYISNIVFNYPYLLSDFHSFLIFSADNEEFGNKNVEEFLNKMLCEHLPYKRSDTNTLIIFFALELNIKLKNFHDTSAKILEFNDSIPALMSFLYAKRNHISTDIFFDKLINIDQQEWWLYVYELFKINGEETLNKLSTDFLYEDFYKWLKNNDISFLSNNLQSLLEEDEQELTHHDLPF